MLKLAEKIKSSLSLDGLKIEFNGLNSKNERWVNIRPENLNEYHDVEMDVMWNPFFDRICGNGRMYGERVIIRNEDEANQFISEHKSK